MNSDVWLNTPIRPEEVNTWLEKPKSMVQQKINARTQTLIQQTHADEHPASSPKPKASLSNESHQAASLTLISSTAESQSVHLNKIQPTCHEDVTIPKPTACEGKINVRNQTVLHSNRAKIPPNTPHAMVSKKKDVKMSKPGVRNQTNAKPKVPHAMISKRQNVRKSKPGLRNQTDAKPQLPRALVSKKKDAKMSKPGVRNQTDAKLQGPHAMVSKKPDVGKSKPVVKNQTDAKLQVPHAMVSITKVVKQVHPIERHQDTAKPTAKPKHLTEDSSTQPQQGMVSKKKDQRMSKPLVQHQLNGKAQLVVIRGNLAAVPLTVKHVSMKKDLRKVPPVVQNRVDPKPQVMIRKNFAAVPATVKNYKGGLKNDTKEVQPVAKNRVDAKPNVVCRKNFVSPTAPHGLEARKKDLSESKPCIGAKSD